jgi:hypothetical protein
MARARCSHPARTQSATTTASKLHRVDYMRYAAQLEVLIGMTGLYEFVRHSRHEADDDFPASWQGSRARVRPSYEYREWKGPDGDSVNELYYAMKGGSAQLRREGDSTNVILSGRPSECSEMATAHELYRNIADTDVCTESVLLEVKVPVGRQCVNLQRQRSQH